MAQQQSSRLNRLLTLLDTGSTLATRRTAAKQIGEIAKSRPEDLNALLRKVCPLLHSKNWDTRVAAAAAIGAIADNVHHITLKDVLTRAQKQFSGLGMTNDLNHLLTTNWLRHPGSTKSLSFRSFDVKKVMDYGAPLLSSGGQEYDVGMDERTPAERLARQRQNLTRRLGLDVCEQFMDVNDMIKDDDLVQHRASENGLGMHGGISHGIEGKQRVQQLVANMVPLNIPRTLSARERNLLKRKAKGSLKETQKGWCEDDEVDEPVLKRPKNTKSMVVDQSQSGDKILMEAVLDEDTGQAGDGRWPFTNFVEQLMHDMFDPVWEKRHGSIMALREILSAQAASAAIEASDLNRILDNKLDFEEKKVDKTVDDKLDVEGNKVDVVMDDKLDLEEKNIDVVMDDNLDLEEKRVESPTRDVKIDLNVDLISEDAPDVKSAVPVDSQNHKDFSTVEEKSVKMEPQVLDSSSSAANTYVMVKPEFDLNEEVKPGLLIDDGTEVVNNNMYNEKPSHFVSNNPSIPANKTLGGVLSGPSVLPEGTEATKMYKAVERAWASNTEFLQDCAIRFLCIFSLDRFGDYVSDQVVAPVRETCAQALGAVLKQMHPFLVHETLSILLQMQGRPEWEVRHGSLLGIKYLVAVRQDMLLELLPRVLPACINGLEDRDDDVRAVAAEAMTPAAAAIVASGQNKVNTILYLLWDILLDLDDLSPSTSSVMHLLAEIYTQQEILRTSSAENIEARPIFDLNETIELDDESEDEIKQMDDPSLLSTLAPRLWPFMRHNISSVRHAAISTLERILESGKKSSTGFSWVIPILGDALRLVYQNLLLEADESIVECSKRVWKLLLESPKDDLATAAEKFFPSWLKLASTAAGSPLETSKMFSPTTLPRRSHVRAAAKIRGAKSGAAAVDPAQHRQKDEARNIDSSFALGVPKVVVGSDTEKSVVQMRVSTSFALGILAASLPSSLHEMLVEVLMKYLSTTSGVQRQVACMVIISWFEELKKNVPDSEFMQASLAAKALRSHLINLLSCCDPALPTPTSQLPYAELTRTYAKMRGEAASLVKQAEGAGITLKDSSIPPLESIGAEAAIEIAMKVASEVSQLQGSTEDKSCLDFVESLRQRLLATAGYLKLLQSNLHISVLASVAGAVVRMGELPVKLNPIIQPLMAAIKREQEHILQQMAAAALAETMAQCIGRKPSPNEKLTKNICTLTCADPVETPQATQSNAASVNLDDIEVFRVSGSKPRPQTVSSAEERARLEGAITRRGGEFALNSLCDKFGDILFEKLPKLWDCLTEALVISPSDGTETSASMNSSEIVLQHGEPQPLINNLQVICSITPFLDKSLQSRVIKLLPAIFGCVRHRHAAVRLTAARCITAMSKAWRQPLMAAVLEKVVPMLDDSSSVEARQGVSMLLMFLVEGLGADLVPYAPFLIVPLLGCMSDTDAIVRQTVTHSFAALVPLLPLAKGVDPPPGLNESLLSRSAEDARFLEQLLDNSRVDDYKLAVELSTNLRRYQQEGINWLAFLKRFKLHGILCDDMGLGKTLQASAIVASDIAERMELQKSNPEIKLLPSLIICPSTLVGHWVFEIEKFLKTDIIKPMQYIGTPQDRIPLQSQINGYNLIVTSYDVLRKDVEFLSKFVWNFCILDEGHIIKNSKSKVTLAVKQIKADHRLILSGTPIQNNVLELWSLFDFLMPGFLGTERQFQSVYGKPILAARDPKCSAKEAEAGALAMEALHKQVMPFLLRRTKDEVLDDLPPKIIQDRYCDLSPLQLTLYDKFSHSQAKTEISNLVQDYDTEEPTSKSSTHVFQALQYLRKLCSHPILVLNEKTKDHIGSFEPETGKDGKLNLHDLHHSPKLLALKEILEECGIGTQTGSGDSPTFNEGGQHRVLVFAQLKGFLDIIERDLFQAHMKGVTYLRLDGSIEPDKRFDVVRAFNSDPTIDVLLLTTHVGGLGLNLTTADTVVFMEHDWNPMRDLQAMDRAHRLGQKRVVNVHRLIMRGTLEEKVMSLQRFKLSVANTIVNAENASLDKMDTTQLLDLFSVSGGGKEKAKQPASDEEQAAANAGAGGGKGLKAMLNGLEELWDQSQYNEEYNLDQFVARLNG